MKKILTFAFPLILLFTIFAGHTFAEDLKFHRKEKIAILFIPGIHHKYIGDSGLFRWSESWKGKCPGIKKVYENKNEKFPWRDLLNQAENIGVDTYILFEPGGTKGEYVDGGIFGHEINGEMIKNSINELIKEGYSKIIIMGHSQAGPNIFTALAYIKNLQYIYSIRLYDPAFASPIGAFATEPVVYPIAKIVTGRVGIPLSPSEEDLTGRNDYLSSIRRSIPDLGKRLSEHNIPVYLMYSGSGLVSSEEIKTTAEMLAKNGCKVFLFSPETGSMKFGNYEEGNKGYLYKKDADNPFNPEQKVPTESKLAHTPKFGGSENEIVKNFYLYGLSKPFKEKEEFETSEEKDFHGVYIGPKIVKSINIEKGVILITLKEDVLRSRPSKNSLSWTIRLPKEER